MRRIFFILAAVSALAACSDFPDLEATASARARNASYPVIVPLDQINARTGPWVQAGFNRGNLLARLAQLRSRADWLRERKVIDDNTRARMQAALARHR